MQSTASRLAALSSADRAAVLASLTEAEASEVLTDWRFWARPEQIAPSGNWQGWLILAGRGYGKTRVGAEYVAEFARRILGAGSGCGETAADTRKVMVEGESGLLSVGPVAHRPKYQPSNREVKWANGSIATTYNGLEPDQLRGPQHHLLWYDELAKMRYAQEAFDQGMFGLRLGDDPRWIATTTPRPIPLIRQLIKQSGVVVTRAAPPTTWRTWPRRSGRMSSTATPEPGSGGRNSTPKFWTMPPGRCGPGAALMKTAWRQPRRCAGSWSPSTQRFRPARTPTSPASWSAASPMTATPM
jgi:Uncharacterized conserved protein